MRGGLLSVLRSHLEGNVFLWTLTFEQETRNWDGSQFLEDPREQDRSLRMAVRKMRHSLHMLRNPKSKAIDERVRKTAKPPKMEEVLNSAVQAMASSIDDKVVEALVGVANFTGLTKKACSLTAKVLEDAIKNSGVNK